MLEFGLGAGARLPPFRRVLRNHAMVLLGNLIWFVFLGGFVLWLGWVVAGCLMYLTIVGIPFGVACFRFAGVAAFPFGKEVVDARWLGESRLRQTGCPRW